ncbi:MAG: hypothetical protein L0Y79_10720 [Chlorobi bacterium]|nr:hypothetical protein [Chlorobiota bacterium]MCI0715298.1 hypothetical protein [Chlorobiota bacterium]
MTKVKNIEVIRDFKIKFNDGFESVVNFKPYIGKGISKALLNQSYFKRVKKEVAGV